CATASGAVRHPRLAGVGVPHFVLVKLRLEGRHVLGEHRTDSKRSREYPERNPPPPWTISLGRRFPIISYPASATSRRDSRDNPGGLGRLCTASISSNRHTFPAGRE